MGFFHNTFTLPFPENVGTQATKMVDFIYYCRNFILIYISNFRDCHIWALSIYTDIQAGIVAAIWYQCLHNALSLFTVDLFYVHKSKRNNAGDVLANK